ncbi:MAG: circadian clock protein KaiC, partial [Methanosarcinales archaeon]|nr:circadian clock protein KaiC [Methanosarcinales archaeon]
DLERLIKENKLRVIKVDPIAYGKYVQKAIESHDSTVHIDAGTAIIENLVLQIQKQIEEIGACRMFIDSVTSLKLATDPTTIRHAILELVRNIENLNCTTLLSSEYNTSKEQFMVEEYLAEGVIRLHIFRVGGEKVRAIEILKMRGIKHDEQVHPYAIEDNGFVVYPTENIHMDATMF